MKNDDATLPRVTLSNFARKAGGSIAKAFKEESLNRDKNFGQDTLK